MLKITKKKLIDSVRGNFYNADYYLVYGRIYNAEQTEYYSFRFVLSLDLCDDLWDCETETAIPYGDALQSMIDGFCGFAGEYFDNDKARADFFDDCNHTIYMWNKYHAA